MSFEAMLKGYNEWKKTDEGKEFEEKQKTYIPSRNQAVA
jgi:hypothetical protein